MCCGGPAKPSPFSSATRLGTTNSRCSNWSSAGRADNHLSRCSRPFLFATVMAVMPNVDVVDVAASAGVVVGLSVEAV